MPRTSALVARSLALALAGLLLVPGSPARAGGITALPRSSRDSLRIRDSKPRPRTPKPGRQAAPAAGTLPGDAEVRRRHPARPDTTRPALPGPRPGGRVKLPNGWGLWPAGRAVPVTDFPLELAVAPGGRLAAVGCAGEAGRVDLVDVAAGRRTASIPVRAEWPAVAFVDDGQRLVVAGGLRNTIDLYDLSPDGHAVLADSIPLGPRWSAGGQYPQGRRIDYGPGAIWPTALAVDDEGGRLYVLSRLDSSLRVVDLAHRAVVAHAALGAVPYACRLSAHRDRLFVSGWSDSSVCVLDAQSLQVLQRVRVGAHPTGLVDSPDGARVFVAEAGRTTVAVVDVASGRVLERLDAAPEAAGRAGSTPDAVALDASGGRLYVAAADNACVAVFDVSVPGRSRALGFVPTGDYPSALALGAGGGALLVANARGLGSAPTSPAAADTGAWCHYLSYRLEHRGALSIVPVPDANALRRGTHRVLAGRPRTEPSERLAARGPIPRWPGAPSPIRWVFYIFKENRSYDQVLGDMREGNGDSALCLFGEHVTPNHHALAREFVLFDNTYCEADGSADGHNWGMGAYANDYVVKSVGTSPVYDYEGGNTLAYPEGGYLWDACARAGVSYRSYGEFVFNPDDPRDTVRAGVPALEGHTAPHYRGYDLTVSDLDRYRAWREEFDRYDRDGGLPRLSIIRLPNDHTEGTCSGRPTPRAHVAENDLALGLMVERISHSRYWKHCAIFVVEDDAANGPDHVDAHRTVALVASPYARRGAVDHTAYTNSGMLRTIELVLGLRPMSQFDAVATPMRAAFTGGPDATPYTHREAGVSLDETNVAGAWGQARSERMNWRVADAAPPDEVAEILWHAMRGADVPLPPRALAARLAPARPGPGREDD